MYSEPPSEKQYDYVSAICNELGIDLPKVFTKAEYSSFIDLHKNEYKRSLQSYELEEEDEY
jgi:tRNA U34 2-thiouridine synthase MnmA/TrmU